MFQCSIDVPQLVSRLQLVMGGQHHGEIVPFCEWVLERGRPARILEIGAGHGGTTELLGHLATTAIISVDLPSGASSGLDEVDCRGRNERLAEIHGHFHGILGDSRAPETLSRVAEILGEESLDLLFIDGDHTESGVRADFQSYLPFVRRGGIVAFHDINSDAFESHGVEVHRFWRRLKATQHAVGHDVREFSIAAIWGGIGAVVK